MNGGVHRSGKHGAMPAISSRKGIGMTSMYGLSLVFLLSHPFMAQTVVSEAPELQDVIDKLERFDRTKGHLDELLQLAAEGLSQSARRVLDDKTVPLLIHAGGWGNEITVLRAVKNGDTVSSIHQTLLAELVKRKHLEYDNGNIKLSNSGCLLLAQLESGHGLEPYYEGLPRYTVSGIFDPDDGTLGLMDELAKSMNGRIERRNGCLSIKADAGGETGFFDYDNPPFEPPPVRRPDRTSVTNLVNQMEFIAVGQLSDLWPLHLTIVVEHDGYVEWKSTVSDNNIPFTGWGNVVGQVWSSYIVDWCINAFRKRCHQHGICTDALSFDYEATRGINPIVFES